MPGMGNWDSSYPWPQGSEASPASPAKDPSGDAGETSEPYLEVAWVMAGPQDLQGGVQWDAHSQGPRFCFPGAAAGISPARAEPQLRSSLTSSGNGDTQSWRWSGCSGAEKQGAASPAGPQPGWDVTHPGKATPLLHTRQGPCKQCPCHHLGSEGGDIRSH